MPKFWTYTENTYVKVKDNAMKDVPTYVGEIGLIESLHEGVIYDYVVRFSDGQRVKFKENELERIEVN